MKTSTRTRRGLGITAGLEAGLARGLAAHCAQLGYHSLWSNDEPDASGLETLAQFAAAAPQLQLGVGVLPLDRHQPARIAAEVERLGLDPSKLWIGVGSGQLRAQIDVLQRAVAGLRELLPEQTRPGSLRRLRDEESFYRTINESHRKHFAAMDVPVGSVGVAASTRPEAREQLAPYQSALDLPIVRVLATRDAASLTAVADAAAP